MRAVSTLVLMARLFYSWDTQQQGTLSLQDVVLGLDRVMSAGLMESIEWFFKLVSSSPEPCRNEN